MNDITFAEGRDNLGSLAKLEFVPIEDIKEYPGVTNLVLDSDITLNDGARWYQVKATFETMGMTAPAQKTIHGDSYSVKISAFIPKLTVDVDAQIADMQTHLFIVRVTDNNGNVRIVGTLDGPVSFTATASGTGTKTSEANGTTISFYVDSANKPFYFVS